MLFDTAYSQLRGGTFLTTFAGGLLLILTGIAVLGFGLFLFYAWLPLLFALVGFDIGILIGRSLTGDVGTLAVVLGIAGAVLLGAASYFLEPYRRILLGVSGGFLLGLSVAAALDLDSLLGGLLARLLAFVCAMAGGILVPRFFNAFVVGASEISGAAIVMIGAHHLLPNVRLFDVGSREPLPVMLLAALGGHRCCLSWESKKGTQRIYRVPVEHDRAARRGGNQTFPPHHHVFE